MSREMQQQFDNPSFDKELGLTEMLQSSELSKLQKIFDKLFHACYRLTDANHQLLVGREHEIDNAKCVAILHDFEPIAYIEVEWDEQDSADTAKKMVELLLQSSAKYLMASRLHIEAINEDYEVLKQKQDELSLSEEKYRILSEQLEVKVQQQVSEIDQNHRQLYQAEKMASVGQLAAGVAHEINNPIGFVVSNLSTAQKHLKLFDELEEVKNAGDVAHAFSQFWREKDMEYVMEDFNELLHDCLEGVTRVADIVKNLKDFSNIDHHEDAVMNLNNIVETTCAIAATELSKKARLVTTYAEIDKVQCQPAHISQALLNILLNAAAAIESDGVIEVSTSQTGTSIELCVKDNGCGMDEEIRKRACEPFFTTRQVGSGTGLGLSVCHDIINAHGGDLRIDSCPGKGTEVCVSLPVTHRQNDMQRIE